MKYATTRPNQPTLYAVKDADGNQIVGTLSRDLGAVLGLAALFDTRYPEHAPHAATEAHPRLWKNPRRAA